MEVSDKSNIAMKRTGSNSIKDVLNQLLREEGLETPLYEYRLLQSIPEIVGSVLSQYITHSFIKNQVLYLKVSSSTARHELFLRRKEFVQRLNHHTGFQVIRDIQLS